MELKNTIQCPGCERILRVSARVVSDGKDYVYYLCPKCEDVARQDAQSGQWVLQGIRSSKVAEMVEQLQALAMEDWRVRSVTRTPLEQKAGEEGGKPAEAPREAPQEARVRKPVVVLRR